MWKRVLTLALAVTSLYALPAAAEFNWYEHSSLKITMETEQVLYEWEYENPASFEFEKGERIVRGEKAKASFEDILSHVDLAVDKIPDETIKRLEGNGYPPIKRLIIYRHDPGRRYQIWSWPHGNETDAAAGER
ncbi:hypothetical protein SAMN05421736_116122 [Evansella caseinilytica]|uniref:Uncharacterized protein n=1 Tax=Evansella caseinilytica TaxID=1503961 RepID=A0A1H3TXI6_9BACI|nr:hypothetical protein [Evansella caseinilytica]SDZ54788.1 hypothetical protein SAMN05421736_116122 [Evansella caseinilytica]